MSNQAAHLFGQSPGEVSRGLVTSAPLMAATQHRSMGLVESIARFPLREIVQAEKRQQGNRDLRRT
jgi:hypothetical protein